MQWYTRLNYMAKQNLGILVGGAFIKKEKFYALSEHDQQVLLDTSRRAALLSEKLARRDDARAYASLVKRGIEVVDLSEHQAAWDAAARNTRENLAGRLYSKSLLESVEKAIAAR